MPSSFLFRRCRSARALLLIPVIPGMAAAEAVPSPALDKVTVTATREGSAVSKSASGAGKSDAPLLETPQSVSVVNLSEIGARGAQSVAEALTYTPGVLIGVGGEDSRFDDILIRGYDAGSTSSNVYRDGLRVASGGQWTRSQFDIYGLESVEVLKGPSAVLYGQVAPGGLVNMTSKRPTTGARGQVSTQYGSFDTWQFTADSSGSLDQDGRLLYRFAGLYRDGGSQIDHTDLERLFLAPSLTWNIAPETHLTVLAAYQEDRGGATYQFLPVNGTLFGTALGKIDRDAFLGEPGHNTFNRDQFSIGYQLKHRINPWISLEQNARYSDIESFYEGVVAGRTVPTPSGSMSRRAVRGSGDAHNLAVDTRLKASFRTGPLRHDLIAGFDFIRGAWDHARTGTNTVPPINIFDPVSTGITAPFTAQVGQDAIEIQKGIYLQEQMSWENWHLILGGRYDDSDIELTNTLTGTTAETTSEAYTGRAALLYRFQSGIAPYLSASSSFEPVSGTDADGNGFDPSEGRQWELGVKYQPNAFDALFTASAFQLTQENVLTLDPADPLFQTQTGEIELRGIELESKIQLAAGLSLIGGWTWMESEITRSNDGNRGNEFANIPSHTGSLWLDYRFSGGPLEGLEAGAGIRYVASRAGDNANVYHIPSYTLFDASIRYDLGMLSPSLKGARLALFAANLADKTYVAKAETVSSANYGPGRTVNLNLSYSW